MFGVFFFLLGLVIGSFFNVVLIRKNTGESVISGGSRCFSCGKKLGAGEMIPLLSFFLQKGRCRYCGSGISRQYPLVEFLVGILAAAVYLKTGFSFWWLYYFAAFSALFLLVAYDLKNKIIDGNFLFVFGCFAAAEFILRNRLAAGLADDLASSFLIALFFYFLWLFSGGVWMGRGDADAAFAASLFLGWPQNLAMLFFAFWFGGILGAALLLARHKRFGLKSEIPFAPFLAAALFIIWFAGAFFAPFYGIIF